MSTPDTWNAISAVATTVATIVALTVVCSDHVSRRRREKALRGVWGPALRHRSMHAHAVIEAVGERARGYENMDPRPEDVSEIFRDLEIASAWPNREAIDQLVPIYPAEAACLAEALEKVQTSSHLARKGVDDYLSPQFNTERMLIMTTIADDLESAAALLKKVSDAGVRIK